MKRLVLVALAWLLLVAQISLVQAMASQTVSFQPNQPQIEARAAIWSRKLISGFAAQPVPGVEASPTEENVGETSAMAEAPAETEKSTLESTGKHKSSDKSVAGGGVIIGGLLTAIFAAVFCYIRVTRRKDGVVS